MNAALPIGFGRRDTFVPFYDHHAIEFNNDSKLHIFRVWKWSVYINTPNQWLAQRLTWLRYKLGVLNARLYPVKLWLRGYQSKFYVNVYEVDRSYGGPEEGGWWYDSGVPFEGIQRNSYGCDTREEAVLVQEWLTRTLNDYQPSRSRYSVIGGADVVAYIEVYPAECFPTERPYYC
jgi:hypothetical protein